MKRREFITLLGGAAAAWPLAVRAQQPAMPVVGLLDPRSPDTLAAQLRAFHGGLKQTGYVEGENVTMLYRWAENQIDRLPVLAADLVRRQVAVIATGGAVASAFAAKTATTTIPIVFVVPEDPVKLGLVTSLARPSGNLTGINFFIAELVAKRLELLRELVPAATRVAVLVNPADAAVAENTVRDVAASARAIGLQIQVLNAGTSREIDVAFATSPRNVAIEERWGVNAEQVRSHAVELVAMAPDVILGGAATGTRALQQATRTIPIVFAFVPDPVALGFVTSLARPGGNITGFANYEPVVAVKWLELLKQIAPGIMRVTFIHDPVNPVVPAYMRQLETAASSFAVTMSGATVRNAEGIERALNHVAQAPNSGLIVAPGPPVSSYQTLVLRLAAQHRLPAVYPSHEVVKNGGLASYGVDAVDLFRRAASYVDRILKGEKPGDLPVQFATKFQLAINLKTAKALGLDPPIQLLARTDEVIE